MSVYSHFLTVMEEVWVQGHTLQTEEKHNVWLHLTAPVVHAATIWHKGCVYVCVCMRVCERVLFYHLDHRHHSSHPDNTSDFKRVWELQAKTLPLWEEGKDGEVEVYRPLLAHIQYVTHTHADTHMRLGTQIVFPLQRGGVKSEQSLKSAQSEKAALWTLEAVDCTVLDEL